MANKAIERDERTTFIENMSYKFGYMFIGFALLLDVAYRSVKFNEAPWDLLGIIIVSGLVMSIYQYRQKILGKTWLRTVITSFALAFIVAISLVFILRLL